MENGKLKMENYMKRIVLMMAVVLMALTSVNAESYRDLLKEYLNVSGQLGELSMQDQLADALSRVVPGEQAAEVAGIVKEYATTGMADDLVDVMLPYFEKNVSEADLKEMMKVYQDERYMKLHSQAQQLLGNLQNDAEYARFMGNFEQALGNIVQGKPVEDVAVPASITPEYKAAFDEYYRRSGVGEVLDNSFSSITGMVKQELENQGVPNAVMVADDMGKYLTRNMQTLTMVIFSRAYSADDLEYMTKMADTEAGRHCMKAAKDMTANPFALVAQMMQKMTTWLQANYPAYGEKMQQVLQIIQGFGK
jgi:hypothetical protein